MAKITEEQKQVFEGKLFTMFPDAKTKGEVTRAQLLEVREKHKIDYHPLWLMKTPIGRGLYALDGGMAQTAVVGNTVRKVEQKQVESFVVDYSNTK